MIFQGLYVHLHALLDKSVEVTRGAKPFLHLFTTKTQKKLLFFFCSFKQQPVKQPIMYNTMF